MSIIARRRVGRTALSVAELGLGTATLGNLYRSVEDATAHDIVTASIAAGIDYIDTAPHYGRGLAERRVGDAVRSRPGAVISTKAGRLMLPDPSVGDDALRDGFRSPMPFRMHYDYTHDGILRSHADSLQRLGLSRVDILFVHDIGRHTHGQAAPEYWRQLTAGGGLAALARLRAEGSVTAIGIGVNEVAVCHDVMREMPLDVILLAGRYTLLEQDALDTLFPACAAAGTSVVVGGPYNSGILAAGTRGGDAMHYDYERAPADVIERVRALEDVARRHGVSLPAAALRFVLAHPVVASVIPGIDRVSRVDATLIAYRASIPPDFWAELRQNGLLRPDAPVPAA